MSTLVEEPVVLAIGAHPTDAECLCGGTLALLTERGWRVALATLTPGEGGGEAASRPPTSPAGQSATVLPADWYCLDWADLSIVYGDELCRRTTALIRAVRPAVVLTHGPEDTTPDHEETSRVLRQACLAAPVRNYDAPELFGPVAPTGRIPCLYYLDPFELIDALGRPVEASLIVDISGVIERKTAMLAQHATQTVWTRGHPVSDQTLEDVQTWGRKRGEQVGCRFGEGFRQHVGPAYPRDNLLKQVLGPLAHELLG